MFIKVSNSCKHVCKTVKNFGLVFFGPSLCAAKSVISLAFIFANGDIVNIAKKNLESKSGYFDV